MQRLTQSHLQNRILLQLNHAAPSTVSALADDLVVTRSSASRAVSVLITAGLVTKEGRRPILTASGKKEARILAEQLPAEAEKAQRIVVRIVGQAEAADASTRANVLEGLSAALQAAMPRITLPDFGASEVAREIVMNARASLMAPRVALPTPAELGLVADTLQSIIAESVTVAWANISSAAATISGVRDIVATQVALYTESLKSLGGWFDTMKAELDALELAGPAMHPIFLVAGFWVGPSTPLGLLRAIKAQYDDGRLTADELRRLFVAAYRSDDYRLLRQAVDHDWGKNRLFAERLHIFRDALEAHIAGKYTLSVTALLPQIEGIASSLTGAAPGRTLAAVQEATQRIDAEIISTISRDVLFAYITTMAYADTRRDAFYQELGRQGLVLEQVLQRHAILHGMTYRYATEENSLRAFLLLDALSKVAVPPSTS